MLISKQGDYAIRTMLELGKCYPETRSIKGIADKQEIPKPFLNKIVQSLNKAGLVETLRGVQGGVRLWSSPAGITLRHIIEAIDGPIAINRCLMGQKVCSRQSYCSAHQVLDKAKKLFLDELDKTSIANLIEGEK